MPQSSSTPCPSCRPNGGCHESVANSNPPSDVFLLLSPSMPCSRPETLHLHNEFAIRKVTGQTWFSALHSTLLRCPPPGPARSLLDFHTFMLLWPNMSSGALRERRPSVYSSRR